MWIPLQSEIPQMAWSHWLWTIAGSNKLKRSLVRKKCYFLHEQWQHCYTDSLPLIKMLAAAEITTLWFRSAFRDQICTVLFRSECQMSIFFNFPLSTLALPFWLDSLHFNLSVCTQEWRGQTQRDELKWRAFWNNEIVQELSEIKEATRLFCAFLLMLMNKCLWWGIYLFGFILWHLSQKRMMLRMHCTRVSSFYSLSGSNAIS